MPTFYNYTEGGQTIALDDAFVSADAFRQGNLWGWGRNGLATLGINNTTSPICTPVTTSAGGANWKQIAVNSYAPAAIKTDGTLWTWGTNSWGGVGVNDTNDRSTPVTTFAGGTNWKQVACGDFHTAAIKTDGTLWTWGRNVFAQLGINNSGFPSETQNRPTAVQTFAGGTNWKQVACGAQHTAAIKTDGTLWTWGYCEYGQLGINNRPTMICTPVTTFAGGTNWKQVACGEYYTAAIKTDGTLWTWGQNSYGQLGINTASGDITLSKCIPVTTFVGGTNWKQVSCGNKHTASIKTDGTLWTWGNNYRGQLGINNTTTPICTPVTTFAGGTNWKQVAGGGYFTAAIKTDGTLWTWGQNNFGQLGVNSATIYPSVDNDKRTPVTTFAGGTNWKQVACTDQYTVAVTYIDDYQ